MSEQDPERDELIREIMALAYAVDRVSIPKGLLRITDHFPKEHSDYPCRSQIIP